MRFFGKPLVESSATPDKGKNRRKYPRVSRRMRVGVRMDQPVFSGNGGGERSPVVDGTLINVSRGGAQFSLDKYLAPDAPCSVDIWWGAGKLAPSASRAHVVRSVRVPRGGYITSVRFVEPLVAVEGPRVA